MARFFTFFLLLSTCSWMACSNDGEAAHSANDTASVSTPDPDSLRQAYQTFMNVREEALPATQIVELGKLYPVDEAPLDTAFFVFRENLREAVKQRDIFTVMESVDKNIKVSFGSENGLADFLRQWGLESEEKTQESELWEVLGAILVGGGTFQQDGRYFLAPYLFSTWPDAYDSYTHGAVTGAGVRMREAPSLNSAVVKLVSHDIVEYLSDHEKTETINGVTAPWVQVKTLDGKEGFIWGHFIGRPIGYRAGFQRGKDDRWRMVLLVAGD